LPNDLILTISQAARLIHERTISPVELTQALLRRIERLDSQICAFNTVTGDLAIKQARQAEAELMRGHYRGPLHGIPFGLKDVYGTAGILTSGYSRVFLNNYPAEHASIVSRLFDGGGILLGKLATHELANGGPSWDLPWPPARNPWNREYFTGGSSTGPGAAVAAGFVPAALGTDTGGSIRIPSAMCGVVGFKPTYGLVSRAGVIPHSFSIDHCGPITRTVEDSAIMLEAIAGYDPEDAASVDRPAQHYRTALRSNIKGLRIAVVRHFWEEDTQAQEDVCKAMESALGVLTRLGAKVCTIRMRPLQSYYDVKTLITKPEVFAAHRRNLIARTEDFGADFLGMTLPGCLIQPADYGWAKDERERMIAELSSLFDQHDVIITASSGPATRLDTVSANRVLDHWSKPNLETPFSVLGIPAIAVCNGFSRNGLPLSMQIAGRAFDEQTVFDAAYVYEQATPWHDRRPKLGNQPISIPQERRVAAVAMFDSDPATRQVVATMAANGGLRLTDERFAQLCAIAPFVAETVARARLLHPKF
jgi:aspartyl-tRNA(Asn)/glutamyl-tRNA(Gln) amidotransferase subunit A